MQFYRKFTIILPIFVAFIILPARTALSVSPDSDIEDLKAAFIYNFTKYIKWPTPNINSAFKIGVLGDSEVIVSLQKLATKKLVDNKPIEIIHFEVFQDIKFCHILFISESENQNIAEILTALGNNPTLTIGDSPDYCERGIMINFFLQNEKVKFEMNPVILENIGLKASSQLQKLARIIQ